MPPVGPPPPVPLAVRFSAPRLAPPPVPSARRFSCTSWIVPPVPSPAVVVPAPPVPFAVAVMPAKVARALPESTASLTVPPVPRRLPGDARRSRAARAADIGGHRAAAQHRTRAAAVDFEKGRAAGAGAARAGIARAAGAERGQSDRRAKVDAQGPGRLIRAIDGGAEGAARTRRRRWRPLPPVPLKTADVPPAKLIDPLSITSIVVLPPVPAPPPPVAEAPPKPAAEKLAVPVNGDRAAAGGGHADVRAAAADAAGDEAGIGAAGAVGADVDGCAAEAGARAVGEQGHRAAGAVARRPQAVAADARRVHDRGAERDRDRRRRSHGFVPGAQRDAAARAVAAAGRSIAAGRRWRSG